MNLNIETKRNYDYSENRINHRHLILIYIAFTILSYFSLQFKTLFDLYYFKFSYIAVFVLFMYLQFTAKPTKSSDVIYDFIIIKPINFIKSKIRKKKHLIENTTISMQESEKNKCSSENPINVSIDKEHIGSFFEIEENLNYLPIEDFKLETIYSNKTVAVFDMKVTHIAKIIAFLHKIDFLEIINEKKFAEIIEKYFEHKNGKFPSTYSKQINKYKNNPYLSEKFIEKLIIKLKDKK